MPILEQSPFDGKCFRHKFREAGLQYEIAVSIISGNIVWVNAVFSNNLKQKLSNGERVVADQGYRDTSCLLTSQISPSDARAHANIRARHETINRSLNIFLVWLHHSGTILQDTD